MPEFAQKRVTLLAKGCTVHSGKVWLWMFLCLCANIDTWSFENYRARDLSIIRKWYQVILTIFRLTSSSLFLFLNDSQTDFFQLIAIYVNSIPCWKENLIKISVLEPEGHRWRIPRRWSKMLFKKGWGYTVLVFWL